MDVFEARTITLEEFNGEEYDHFGKVAFRQRAALGRRSPGRTFMTLWLEEGYAVLMLDQDLQAKAIEERPDVFTPHPSKWGERGSTIIRLERASEAVFRKWLGAAVAHAARK